MKIAFYKGTHEGLPGLFNRAVRWWTRGAYSHTEMVFEQNADGQYLCASASKMDGGVRFKNIILDPDKWDVFEINADRDYAYQWFKEREGLKYDVLGLFGFVIRRLEDDAGKYFCSEACAASIGITEAWRFDPNTFAAAIRRVSTGA